MPDPALHGNHDACPAFMAPPSVLMHLCTGCRHGGRCKGYVAGTAALGGITCLAYEPQRSGKPLSVAHIMALPDREPCADCACRKGSQPNGTHHSMADFLACVEDRQTFLCHEGGAGRVCAGWLRAVKARSAPHDALAAEVGRA